MLPPPTLTFTIPSIHDDTVLDCRIYHPASLVGRWEKKAAIIAHPYAPLGGCYDDPVVDIVASVILKQGFVVGTFNFRGAGSSKGRTSWTAKPEREDYMSFVGFMAYYLQYLHCSTVLPSSDSDSDDFLPNLATIPSHALPPAQIQPPRKCHTSPVPSSEPRFPERNRLEGHDQEEQNLLLLAGYSYGSLITTQLPNTPDILSIFSRPDVGSAASEIRLRAEHLAKQQNELLATLASPPTSSQRGRHSLQIGDSRLVVPHSPGVRVGGEETNPSVRRASQEGRRSLDSTRLRKSLDRVRPKSHHNLPTSPRHSSYTSQSSENPPEPIKSANRPDRLVIPVTDNPVVGSSQSKIIPPRMEPVEMTQLRTSYLLISPLQGIIKELATMSILRPFTTAFNPTLTPNTSHQKRSHGINKLAQTDTLAVFGSTDAFTNAKKLRSWATKLENQGLESSEDIGEGRESKFRWREVDGAGHFWHDYEHIKILRDEVKKFIRSL